MSTETHEPAWMLLRNRVALLRDMRLGDGENLTKGSLGSCTGRDSDQSLGIVFDRNTGAEIPVPIDICAYVDVEGALPRRHTLAIQYSAVVGSQAQGLAADDSDIDRRGFFLASPQIQFSLTGPPEQLIHDDDQLCYWEVEKFLRLALKANPTVLETLYSPTAEINAAAMADPLAQLKQRGAFLSRRAYQTFMGYADSQFEKMERARHHGGVFKWQHAMHLIRLLRVGIRLMRTGELDVVVPRDERDDLLSIKRGERDWDDVKRVRTELVKEFKAEAEKTDLPDEPDSAAVEAFLVQLRLDSVQAVLP